MNATIFGATGLSLLLLLGSGPAVLLAHEGHDHGDRRSRSSAREDVGRSAPPRESDQWEEEDKYDEEDETDRPASRRYSPRAGERSSPREHRERPW
jgi:hypothetical protein